MVTTPLQKEEEQKMGKNYDGPIPGMPHPFENVTIIFGMQRPDNLKKPSPPTSGSIPLPPWAVKQPEDEQVPKV